MSSHDLIKDVFKRHTKIVSRSLDLVLPSVQKGAELLLATAKTGGRLFTCGNGGSAADSQHFAGEWLCRYKEDRPPLPAIALTTDTSALTAISNDYDFSHVFARKLHALGTRGDVLAAFSTSGKSKNILAAIYKAREKGIKTILLTGEGGKNLRKAVDVAIAVPSKETARIQEVHQLVYHAWCEFIDANYRATEKFKVTFS